VTGIEMTGRRRRGAATAAGRIGTGKAENGRRRAGTSTGSERGKWNGSGGAGAARSGAVLRKRRW